MNVPTADVDELKKRIRHVPDFPKAGHSLLRHHHVACRIRDGFHLAIDSLATPFKNQGIDLVVGIESRGFIFGSAVADRIGAGFSPVRKPGKLPSTTMRVSYALEYGTDTLEMHDDAVRGGQRVLIVDDLLATGGTAKATCDLVRGLGGDVQAVACLIELTFLNGRARLQDERLYTVLQY